jgi:hypothetical protein
MIFEHGREIAPWVLNCIFIISYRQLNNICVLICYINFHKLTFSFLILESLFRHLYLTIISLHLSLFLSPCIYAKAVWVNIAQTDLLQVNKDKKCWPCKVLYYSISSSSVFTMSSSIHIFIHIGLLIEKICNYVHALTRDTPRLLEY